MRFLKTTISALLTMSWFTVTTDLQAEDLRIATTVAKWISDENSKSIIVSVSDLLTPSQREIVNSGFSTFTLFAISDKKINDDGLTPDIKVICNVKYDTWEERYQMLRVDPAPVRTLVTKDYKTWADECLRINVKNRDIISSLHKGGELNGILQIRQSTPDEGAKIKNWLVQQQSGFMQGLYAHMLGDFQFKGTIRIRIQVPPMPIMSGEAAKNAPLGSKGL